MSRWRFRHPSPDPTDLRLHKSVRDCWTDWIPRTGASDAELANALRRIEGTRLAIGASQEIAQQYADECKAFIHLHGERLISRLAPPPHPRAEGMVLVPREPTETMLTEAWKAQLNPVSEADTIRTYRAMLSAAPSEGSASQSATPSDEGRRDDLDDQDDADLESWMGDRS